MTDRHVGYIVTLEKDIREDDAEASIKAIQMIRGVVSVKPLVAGWEQHIAEERVRQDLINKLWNILHADFKLEGLK